MKWYDSYKYKPKHGTKIWLWNREKHHLMYFYAGWDDDKWMWDLNLSEEDKKFIENAKKMFAPVWAYVFEDEEPQLIKKELEDK